jgi:DNA polymerase (family 10)
METPRVSNDEVAHVLERVADLLEAQRADGFRVRAYRLAAETARRHPRPLAEILSAEGAEGLQALPHIGKSLAASIEELLLTGRLRQLDRLEGEVPAEALLATVPTIGEELAHRIHETIGVSTLEELEEAAHDGRLARVKGFGDRRVRAVREALDAILSRSARRRARRLRARERGEAPERPSAAAILDVDAEYREKAEKGTLRKIAPRRFNPSGEAWLPILHTSREGWYFTALYSNTARAHRLGKTRDWVVVFYERDGVEGQCTVVTEHEGPRAGRRVIRGREGEVE